MANRVRKHWTIEELDSLPDDGNTYELIDGELFVTPAPAFSHELIVARLTRILDPYVEANGLGYVLHRGAVRKLRENTHVEPDLMVRQPPEDPSAGWASPPMPILVAEVASDSTWRRDRVHKRELYIATLRIPEYWILDGESREVCIVRPGHADVVAAEMIRWHPAGVAAALEVALAGVFWPPSRSDG